MQIWPAIDLIEGSCVRLSQGDFSRRTSYGSSPADMASRWVSEGASGLHIIDLDAATTGTSSNMSAIGQIIAQNDVDLQVGGGIRTKECVEAYLELGAQRLVISTQAVEDCKWVEHAAHKYPEHLIVSIDAKNGKVAYDGWSKTASASILEHARKFADLPLAAMIFTDIDRAGMQTGPNLETISQIKEIVRVPFIASGGISTYEHLRQLAEAGIDGCVIGKALYEGKLSLTDAIASLATINH